jgi:AcrR family transcriptional regulator
MGRIAGVSAEETRTRLLDAAATVFARRGYEGASISEICSEAGLSSGSIYAHYGSKAVLFGTVLAAHGRKEFDRLLTGAAWDGDIADLFEALGRDLDRRAKAPSSLLVEGIVAAKRDPEVAAILRGAFADRARRLADLVRAGQGSGTIDPGADPDALARLCLMLAFGSLLSAALKPEPVDHEAWGAVIGRVVDGFRTGKS